MLCLARFLFMTPLSVSCRVFCLFLVLSVSFDQDCLCPIPYPFLVWVSCFCLISCLARFLSAILRCVSYCLILSSFEFASFAPVLFSVLSVFCDAFFPCLVCILPVSCLYLFRPSPNGRHTITFWRICEFVAMEPFVVTWMADDLPTGSGDLPTGSGDLLTGSGDLPTGSLVAGEQGDGGHQCQTRRKAESRWNHPFS